MISAEDAPWKAKVRVNRDAATAVKNPLRFTPWTVERMGCFVIQTTAVR